MHDQGRGDAILELDGHMLVVDDVIITVVDAAPVLISRIFQGSHAPFARVVFGHHTHRPFVVLGELLQRGYESCRCFHFVWIPLQGCRQRAQGLAIGHFGHIDQRRQAHINVNGGVDALFFDGAAAGTAQRHFRRRRFRPEMAQITEGCDGSCWSS